MFDLLVERGELFLLFGGGEVDEGALEAAAEIDSAVSSGFGFSVEVVEEGIHLEEVFLGDRVVFVVVADGALEGEAHEGGADGGDAVDDIFEVRFFGEGGADVDDEVEAVESGGDELFLGGVGVEVTGNLVDGELVVGEVGVEGVDDPVAIGGVVAEVVVVVSVGVCDADEVEPVFGHVLAVGGGVEESVDEFVVRVFGAVVEEVGNLLAGGWESGEVEGESSNEGAFVGVGFR